MSKLGHQRRLHSVGSSEGLVRLEFEDFRASGGFYWTAFGLYLIFLMAMFFRRTT